MTITLIGYRGSGKSSVARPLAERLGWEWIDADDELERRAGRSIRDIFDQEGETGFRQREREVLADLLARDALVVAAGGGAVLDPETRARMRRAGPVVWLQASPRTLAERIANDRTSGTRRPDLTHSGGQREVETLLAARTPLYHECATITIDTEQADVETIVERLVRGPLSAAR